ncbi:MAG: hypothetical protein QM730_21205 [Anaerolineales bacterium]
MDQNNIWVAGPSGVAHYNSLTAKTTRYSYPDGLVGAFYRLKLAPGGSILAIGKDVFRFDGYAWKQDSKLFPDPKDWVVLDLIFAADGTPWMIGRYLPTWGAGDEIYRYDGMSWQKMLGGSFDVQFALSTDGKTIWATSWEGVKYYKNNSWGEISYPFDTLSPGIHIYDFVVDAQDHIWLTIGGTGKSGVLYYFDGSNWETIELEPNTALGTIWGDPVHGIWYPVQDYSTVTGDVELVHRIGMQVVTSISLPFDDISIYSFNAFTEAPDGSIWLGADGANRWTTPGQPGLYHFANEIWTRTLMDADIPYLSYEFLRCRK